MSADEEEMSWECPNCTFKNDLKREKEKCVLCGNPMPEEQRKRAAALDQSSAADEPLPFSWEPPSIDMLPAPPVYKSSDHDEDSQDINDLLSHSVAEFPLTAQEMGYVYPLMQDEVRFEHRLIAHRLARGIAERPSIAEFQASSVYKSSDYDEARQRTADLLSRRLGDRSSLAELKMRGVYQPMPVEVHLERHLISERLSRAIERMYKPDIIHHRRSSVNDAESDSAEKKVDPVEKVRRSSIASRQEKWADEPVWEGETPEWRVMVYTDVGLSRVGFYCLSSKMQAVGNAVWTKEEMKSMGGTINYKAGLKSVTLSDNGSFMNGDCTSPPNESTHVVVTLTSTDGDPMHFALPFTIQPSSTDIDDLDPPIKTCSGRVFTIVSASEGRRLLAKADGSMEKVQSPVIDELKRSKKPTLMNNGKLLEVCGMMEENKSEDGENEDEKKEEEKMDEAEQAVKNGVSMAIGMKDNMDEFDPGKFVRVFAQSYNVPIDTIVIRKLCEGSCIVCLDIQEVDSLTWTALNDEDKIQESVQKLAQEFAVFATDLKPKKHPVLEDSQFQKSVSIDLDYSRFYSPESVYWEGKLEDTRDRGGLDYYCPVGWRRYAINVCEPEEVPALFTGCGVMYHGTHYENALSILFSGLVGTDYQADHGDGVYLSPSIKYCAHPRYASVWKIEDDKARAVFGGGNWAQFVFEVRVRKSLDHDIADDLKNETFGAATKIDPNWKNSQMEYLIPYTGHDAGDRDFLPINGASLEMPAFITGLMVRVTDEHPALLPESEWWWNMDIPLSMLIDYDVYEVIEAQKDAGKTAKYINYTEESLQVFKTHSSADTGSDDAATAATKDTDDEYDSELISCLMQ